MEQENVEFIEERGPSYLVEQMVLVTDQIHRSTDFEKGFPIHYSEINGAWLSDPLVHDDQALVVNVRDKGLVVLTGCGHAGAINPNPTINSFIQAADLSFWSMVLISCCT